MFIRHKADVGRYPYAPFQEAMIHVCTKHNGVLFSETFLFSHCKFFLETRYLPKHIIVTYASNVPESIMHVQSTEHPLPGISDSTKRKDPVTCHSRNRKDKRPKDTAELEPSGLLSKMKPTRIIMARTGSKTT